MSDLKTILEEGITPNHALNSMYEIENVLLLIGEMNHKIDYYKGLKQHRIQTIDEKISALDDRIAVLRSIILNTMQKVSPNDKTLNFPSIGKVSRRKPKESIVVENQEAVISFLENKGEKEQVIRRTETVDKRKLNSLVSRYREVGEDVPGVSVVKGSESLSISFEKTDEVSNVVHSTLAEVDLDKLDALAV